MSTRRPLLRSHSGNGRHGDFNGDVIAGKCGRVDNSSYQTAMRTEPRNTFCSMMAQLAVETQPSFETTLKSKAVSESCNVKFTCVVSGNPKPEVTWYKDDMEMDRYCGLPKYEIFCNGKTHTLQIHNSTLEDAAIYQASARNSKGIVSCSGLLEVGTMNEFRIHQRFFAKLKQKADSKRKDLEQNHRVGGESPPLGIAVQPRVVSPIRRPRLVRSPSEPGPTLGPPPLQEPEPPAPEEKPAKQPEARPAMQPAVPIKTPIANGFAAHPEPVKERGKPTFLYFGNKVEIVTARQGSKETPANKEVKTSKEDSSAPAGGSSGDSSSALETSSKEKETVQEEMSLAQYLTEISKTELPGPQQNGALQDEAQKLGPTPSVQTAMERETPKETAAQRRARPDISVPAVSVSAETTGQKGPESPGTLACMFSSLRDMFFRNKNKIGDPDAATGAVANATDTALGCEARGEGKGPSSAPQPPHPEPPQTNQPAASAKTKTPTSQLGPRKVDSALSSAHMQAKSPASPNSQTPETLGKSASERKLGSESPSLKATVKSASSSPSTRAVGGVRTAPPRRDLKLVRAERPGPDCSRSPETKPTPKPSSKTKVTVDHTQTNVKNVLPGQDLSPCHHKQEIQPRASSGGHVEARPPDKQLLHNHIHYPSKTPSDNTQFHTNGLDESQKRGRVRLGTSSLDKNAGTKVVSKCPVRLAVKPEQAEPPGKNAVGKDRGAECVGEVKIPAGNLRSRGSNAPSVQVPAEKSKAESRVNACLEKEKIKVHGGKSMTETLTVSEKKGTTEGKNIPMHVAHKNKYGGLASLQDEKAATKILPKPSMIVQAKLREGPQAEKVQRKVPKILGSLEKDVQKDAVSRAIIAQEPKTECITLQLRRPEVPQVLDRMCSKTIFVKSQVENISAPHTPLVGNNPMIPKQENSPNDITVKDQATEMSDSIGKRIPVTPIQQITESHKDISETKENHKAAQLDQEVKAGSEMVNQNSSGQHSTGLSADATPAGNISVEDNSKLNNSYAEDQLSSAKSSVITRELPKIPSFVVPPISITCSGSSSTEEIQPSKHEVEELSALSTLQEGVINDLDSCTTLSAAGSDEITSTHSCIAEETPASDSDAPPCIIKAEPAVKEMASSVSECPQGKVIPHANIIITQTDEEKKQKQPQSTSDIVPDQHVKVQSGSCKGSPNTPESPRLGSRESQGKDAPYMDASGLLAVPAIHINTVPLVEKHSKGETAEDGLPPAAPSRENSPRLRKRDSLTPIPSATQEELALGARRKIFLPKSKTDESASSLGSTDAPVKKEAVLKKRTTSQEQEAPYQSPNQSRRPAPLQLPAGQQTPPLLKRSPLLGRKKTTLEVPKCPEDTAKEPDALKTEPKTAEDKLDPLKAPKLMRKVRAEPFSDSIGHLKLFCQFFNVLSDSTITWCRDEAEIVQGNRSAGDESQVALAIVHVSSADCGVYSCSMKNEYGTDSSDFFLSATILSEFLLRADLEVGQEIEMTPMLFAKGLADPGYWGNKFFGRIMITESQIGDGCARKACRAKVIYGLEPAFESGSTCVIKVRNPISYGDKDESNLVERNLEITQQECKVQNTIREYCKVFAAEARVAGNCGPILEVIPLYLLYQPANTIPYATAETDLRGVFLKHSLMDTSGRLIMRSGSEVAQMCCTFQHWIHQWTNGNLLLSQLDGVDGKITNVRVATKQKGFQGLSDRATPKVFEQFVTQHQCNDYCSRLGLRSLKVMESPIPPPKRSPMPTRRGSASPQALRKGGTSPQTPRKVSSSPRLAKRSSEMGTVKPMRE